MTTTEKNALIAVFMNGVLETPGEPFKPFYSWFKDEEKRAKHYATFDKLKYNKSWDWLIPVLKKIDDLLYASYVDVDDTVQDFINKWWETNTKTLQYTNDQLKFGTDINEVYEDVIDFINFYDKYTNGRYN